MDAKTLAICTGARIDRAMKYLQAIVAAMIEYEITTPKRQAAFLAQIGHESGGLRYLREIWGPNDAQRRYEGRRDLGNVMPGDGYRFAGRGFIQITGRANYKKYGDILGLDLIGNPDLAAEPVTAARIAGVYWAWNSCNDKADNDDFEAITRRINGGLNGYEERCALWALAKEALQA